MASENENGGFAVQAYAGEWELESPFLLTPEPGTREAESAYEANPLDTLHETLDSPFRTEGGAGGAQYRPEAEELVQFLANVRDPAFNDSLYELMNEASDLVEGRYTGEYGDPALQTAEAERLLHEHFAPLYRETENLLDGMAGGLDRYDLREMGETELENLLGEYQPAAGTLQPVSFEFFLKNIWNKATKVVKGAVDLAKKGVSAAAKLGLGPILNKLKDLVWPLLNRVLKFALNKLPAGLRPIAQQLAKRLGLGETAEMEVSEEFEGIPAHGDPEGLQREFDGTVAELLFAEGEAEQDATVGAYAAEFEQQFADVAGDLDRARANFAHQITQLRPGEDPTPALEQFVPAVLLAAQPIAKMAISFVGRTSVVNTLAGLLANLIERYIGRDQAINLSRFIVDAGLGLMGLETAPEARAAVGADAVASTVQETVLRVAQEPPSVLENGTLLKAAVQEAFEAAAAANFADQMLKPDLREAAGANSVWVLKPSTGRKYYKKNTLIPKVTITPQIARTVKTFRGMTLASFLKDKLGLSPDGTFEARVHLYEAICGTWLSRISKHEKDVPGLGSAARTAWSQIHPLTPEAATALLGQPNLGKAVPARYLQSRHGIEVGQRFYFLEIPGARARVSPPVPPEPGRLQRSSQVNLTLDFRNNRIVQYNFYNEGDAQGIAFSLRQNKTAGAVKLAWESMGAGLNSAIDTITTGQLDRHVKIVHEAVLTEGYLGPIVKRLLPVVLRYLKAKLVELLKRYLAEYFEKRAQEFIRATEDRGKDGVTVIVVYKNMPGMQKLGKLLRGESVGFAGDWFSGLPDVDIEVVAGFRS